MTQHQRIYSYMERFGSISPMDAFNDLGITKLSTRIGEMRRKGIHIDQRLCVGRNRFGEDITFMRYSLHEH